MSTGQRTRITIDSVPLVVQPATADIAAFPPAGRGEIVTELAVTAHERAQGVRRFEVVVEGWLFEAAAEPAARAELRDRVAHQAAEHHPTARLTLRAQIPGRVVRVWVNEGEAVERGQRLLAIEAMKMENEIRAPHAGRVAGLRVEVGGRIELGDELLTID